MDAGRCSYGAAPAPTVRSHPLDRFAAHLYAAFGLALALFLAFWMTSSEVLPASELRGDGRVLTCKYSTGAGVKERQRAHEAGEAGSDACPLLHRGEVHRGAA